MRPSMLIGCLFFAFASTALCRIGETAIQFADRYGTPKDTPPTRSSDRNMPLVEEAIHHRYEYQGWRIWAAFLQLDGPCVRMEYSKLWNGQNVQIQEYELRAIMNANTPAGMSWKAIAYDNPNSPNEALTKAAEAYFAGLTGQKMWQRSDGAILWLRSHLIARLELPAARDYEAQLKSERKQKARASVPQF